MVLVSSDQFLSRLTLMFDRSRKVGEVQITMKRYDGRIKPKKKADKQKESEKSSEENAFYCLLRATCKGKKISTVISPDEVGKFHTLYCNLLKSNIDGLKKAKKTKTKKAID